MAVSRATTDATECLDVYNNQTAPGTNELWNGQANQKWTVQGNGTSSASSPGCAWT